MNKILRGISYVPINKVEKLYEQYMNTFRNDIMSAYSVTELRLYGKFTSSADGGNTGSGGCGGSSDCGRPSCTTCEAKRIIKRAMNPAVSFSQHGRLSCASPEAPPKFKLGDFVQYIGSERAVIYRVESYGIDGSYNVRVVASEPDDTSFEPYLYKNITDKYLELMPIEAAETKSLCICPIFDLMNKGCQCGQINRERGDSR